MHPSVTVQELLALADVPRFEPAAPGQTIIHIRPQNLPAHDRQAGAFFPCPTALAISRLTAVKPVTRLSHLTSQLPLQRLLHPSTTASVLLWEKNMPDTAVQQHVRGFTLLELVTCVVTTGSLIALLLPTLTGISKSRKEIACLNNLRQIAYANAVYAAQDPDNMALPVHAAFFDEQGIPYMWVGPYEAAGKSGIGETDFVTGEPGDPLNSRYGTHAGFGPARRPLNKILYGDIFPDYTDDPGPDGEHWLADTQLELDVLHCPSDSGYSGVHSPAFRDERLTSFNHFGTSYGANMLMVAQSTGGQMRSNSPFLHSLSRLIAPATTLSYQDNNGRFAWAAVPDPCDFIDGIPGVVNGWHGKEWTFNSAFLDGHANSIYMHHCRSVDIGRYPDDWWGPGSSGTYTFYRCIIVRGEGWQKDTLPASTIPTDLYHSGAGRASYEGGIE